MYRHAGLLREKLSERSVISFKSRIDGIKFRNITARRVRSVKVVQGFNCNICKSFFLRAAAAGRHGRAGIERTEETEIKIIFGDIFDLKRKLGAMKIGKSYRIALIYRVAAVHLSVCFKHRVIHVLNVEKFIDRTEIAVVSQLAILQQHTAAKEK